MRAFEIERMIKHAKMVIRKAYRKHNGRIHPGLEIVVERKRRLITRLEKELKEKRDDC